MQSTLFALKSKWLVYCLSESCVAHLTINPNFLGKLQTQRESDYPWERVLMKLIRLVFLALVFTGLSATAAPVLQIREGKLVGASNVQVGTGFFDVQFIEGTCAILSSSCSPASAGPAFAFLTASAAAAASQALLDVVLIDSKLGHFDSVPSQVFGCDNVPFCYVLTPYYYDVVPGVVITSWALNHNFPPSDSVASIFKVSSALDMSAAAYFVWASWRGHVETVPEPTTLALFGAALIALTASSRRKRQA